jgi:hypothetical protein
MKEHMYTTFGGVNENREKIQAKGMVLAFFLQKNPSFKKSHPISIKSVGHLRTVNGNTRLGSTTQNVLEEYGESNSEIVVTIDRLKIIQEECPDMWIIHDVQRLRSSFLYLHMDNAKISLSKLCTGYFYVVINSYIF